jgi:hypothetical protein
LYLSVDYSLLKGKINLFLKELTDVSDIISELYFETLDLHTLPEELREQHHRCTVLSAQLQQKVNDELFDAYDNATSQMESMLCQFYFRRGIQVAVQLIVSGQSPI